MLKANERRQKILEILCVRRQETMENLAQEFNVTTRTIRNDIEELTLAHPIETVRGRYGGGVRVADGYYLGRKYLKPDQQELLEAAFRKFNRRRPRYDEQHPFRICFDKRAEK